MSSFLQITAIVLASFSAVMSIPLFLRLRWPAPALWFLKLYVAALSPLFSLIGVLSIIVGLTTGSAFISLIGIYRYILQSF